MRCELCKGRTGPKKVTKQHWVDKKLYVVENVAAEVCSECGERYFHADTLDAIDAMLRGKHAVKKKMEVEVVTL